MERLGNHKSLMNGKTKIEGHKTNLIMHELTLIYKLMYKIRLKLEKKYVEKNHKIEFRT